MPAYPHFREWVEAGGPQLPADEADRIEPGHITVAEGLWVTGGEEIRPPAKPLIVDQNPSDLQELGGFLRVTLPVLEVAA